jgi:hypothetical protein
LFHTQELEERFRSGKPGEAGISLKPDVITPGEACKRRGYRVNNDQAIGDSDSSQNRLATDKIEFEEKYLFFETVARIAGSVRVYFFPGADAPGYMLSPALQTF